MYTLVEIASAVAQLSLPDQKVLLRQLTAKVKAPQKSRVDSARSREKWAAELKAFAESISTGKQGTSTEKILEELREDRV